MSCHNADCPPLCGNVSALNRAPVHHARVEKQPGTRKPLPQVLRSTLPPIRRRCTAQCFLKTAATCSHCGHRHAALQCPLSNDSSDMLATLHWPLADVFCHSMRLHVAAVCVGAGDGGEVPRGEEKEKQRGLEEAYEVHFALSGELPTSFRYCDLATPSCPSQ